MRILTAALVMLAISACAVAADDRHAGYYYPEPVTVERYEPRAERLIEANRARRIGFASALVNQKLQSPYPADYALFAKGEDAEKLIIVSLEEGRIDTIYRARALLAVMTAAARVTPLFRDRGIEEQLTFLDLLHMLGFEQVTVSDGRSYALQIQFGK